MNIAIIAAAGTGKRMQASENKVFLQIGSKPVIYHTIMAFEASPHIDAIVIVAREEDMPAITEIIKENRVSKVSSVVAGGKERQDSVYNGLKAARGFAEKDSVVLIHNGCNPFVSQDEIARSAETAREHGACVCAQPAKDTIRVVKNDAIVKTLDRSGLWHMQTPQAIQLELALEAFESAEGEAFQSTDDAALVERLGREVRVIPCSQRNFKITTKDDLELANALFGGLVGYGEDSHRFSDRPGLVLGGVKIHGNRLMAHSDGDVVLHSLFNAISGAMGGRSIGHYFPDNEEANLNRDSSEFFRLIREMLKSHGRTVSNISISIEAGKPRIEPFTGQMKESIAALLGMDMGRIGITATSGEGLTPFGRGEGIRAASYVSLK
ncbi:MAG: 2-C-methyl-D-erythritol 4-phosphate cytidylyltransferase [archaeon]